MPDKIKQNTDYGYDIQKVYLEMMLSDAQTFVRCQNIFDHTLFDRRLQPAAEFIYNIMRCPRKKWSTPVVKLN